jgi:hypothetical protein
LDNSYELLSTASYHLYQAILVLQELGYKKEVIDLLIKEREKLLEDAYQAY